jgi:hypothetical protein
MNIAPGPGSATQLAEYRKGLSGLLRKLVDDLMVSHAEIMESNDVRSLAAAVQLTALKLRGAAEGWTQVSKDDGQ